MAVRNIYLAGGCFWGLEELLRDEPGVVDTEVGYTGAENDNPTTKNRQGNDVGSSYRSAIFYQSNDELEQAKLLIDLTNKSGLCILCDSAHSVIIDI